MSNELTKSARRVFDILELFRERQCPLRLKDVVDSLDMPTSSAAALLKTMAQMNYLSFESTSRAYLPTLRLSQLGSWVTAANYESGPIQEAVRRIGARLAKPFCWGRSPTSMSRSSTSCGLSSRCNITPPWAPRFCWSIPA